MEKFNVTYIYLDPLADDSDRPPQMFGLDYEDKQYFLASITDLRIDIAVQKREVELGDPSRTDLITNLPRSSRATLTKQEVFSSLCVRSGSNRQFNHQMI
jgi:hypothetical protein